MRCISKRFVIDKFKNDEYFKSFVSLINVDPSLCLEMKDDSFLLYKNGIALLNKIKDKKDGLIYYETDEKFADVKEPLKNINEKKLQEYSARFDKYFMNRERKKEKDDEKEFQFALAKQLYLADPTKSGILGIIPEYCQKTKFNVQEESLWRIDLVVLNIPKGERPFFTLVEIKREDKALENDNGIAKHLEDFKKILTDKVVLKTLCNDLELVFLQKVEFGLIPNGQGFLTSGIDVDYTKTKALIVFADLDENSKRLINEEKKITWNEYDKLPIEFSFVKSSNYDFAKYPLLSIEDFSRLGFN